MEAALTKPPMLEWDELAQRTCVVTVTYGDRLHLLEDVIAAAFEAAAGKVIVVDNGAAPASRAGMHRLQQTWGGRLEVVTLSENRGSAGGFKAGLEKARTCVECDFIWLLDDDNAPRPDALRRLWHAYGMLGADPDNTLLSLRRNQKEQVLAVTQGVPVQFVSNAFVGFHLKHVPTKVSRRLARAGRCEGPVRFPLVSVGFAPYGGFFFHRAWLDRVGLPDERLYLYGDDQEFSLRFVRAGGRIYLCAASEVVDLETSWHHRPVASRPWVSPDADERRLYYGLRNSVQLEKDFTTSPIAYWTNVCAYLGFLLVWGLLRDRSPAHLMRRFRLLLRALRDGSKDRLGKAAHEGPVV